MKNINLFIISEKKNVKEAMEQLNAVNGMGLYVVDRANQVIGSITDGDIRRGILKGFSIQDSVVQIMKKEFVWAKIDSSDHEKTSLLEKFQISSIPLLDENRRIIDIHTVDTQIDNQEIPVVLLAGGMGIRLGKITESIPKPMVPIAGKPILERIIKSLTDQGFRNFFISVNYMAEQIEKYFDNGQRFGCQIEYLREKKRLGTAGPLGLIYQDLMSPIVVMNGDVLTQVDLGMLLAFHKEQKAKITMCVRDHQIQVPFGVVEIESGVAKAFIEKPVHNFNVNAGIYIIEPSILSEIPKDQYYDMSSLITNLIEKKISISCFPIIESWIDVGRESDLRTADAFYSQRTQRED